MHITREGSFLYLHKVPNNMKKYLLDMNARYDKISHIYSIPYSSKTVQKLAMLNFTIPEYIEHHLTLEQWMMKRYLQAQVPDDIVENLFPYQVDGVRYLMAGFSLLADYMGLGKTITAIAFMKTQYKNRTVVVCPAFLKEKWAYEIRKWSNFPVTIIYGQKKIEFSKRGIYIINYNILQYHMYFFNIFKTDMVIADEFHLCKNDATARTKAIRKLVSNTNKFIALTGTPILNNAIELYPVLNMIDPLQFYSRTLFERQYCKTYQGRITDSKNHEKLFLILKKSIMIRRTFDEVKHQFGDRYTTIVDAQIMPFRLTSYEEYDKAESNISAYIYEKEHKIYGDAIRMQRPRILKDIIYDEKKEQIFNWIDNFLLSGDKIALFFTRTRHLKEFAERYDATMIYGDTPAKKRLQISNNFNINEKQVLCCNIKASGVGLDLIGCHYVGFVDLDDVWENMSQAISRFDRIGQKAPIVSVYYFVGLNTIEEYDIFSKLDKKHDTAKRIIDGRVLKQHERIRKS